LLVQHLLAEECPFFIVKVAIGQFLSGVSCVEFAPMVEFAYVFGSEKFQTRAEITRVHRIGGQGEFLSRTAGGINEVHLAPRVCLRVSCY